MAIYRFRVTFEDYEDVYREIDVPSKSTFFELHQSIHAATGYEVERASSFYVSNDQWKKGTEIAYLPNDRKKNAGVLEMELIKMSKFIDDPHQKFYYIYNFDRPYDFHVELKEEEGKSYPLVFKSVGEAPKSITAANFPVAGAEDDEDDDFVDESSEEYGVDEEDDYDMFDDEEEGGEEEGQSEKGMSDDY